MTRDEWRFQMLVLTHEETDAEHYNAALHTIETWDVAQRMKIDHLEQENAQLKAELAQCKERLENAERALQRKGGWEWPIMTGM